MKYRNLKNRFRVSGGDPTGSGKGGSSIYGKKFNDEIHEDLRHTGNQNIIHIQETLVL